MAQFTEIITENKAKKIYEYMKNKGSGTLLLLDIDDTIITPYSHFFRPFSPYYEMITELKKSKPKEDLEILLSHWRLKRKVQLVDKDWPRVINKLKEEDYQVFGLTKIDIGPLGSIPSMEEWRYQELLSLGIEFSKSTPDNQIDCAFYKGLMMTGNLSKSKTFSRFVNDLNYSHIVFVDDRPEYIQDVQHYCSTVLKCPFTGILFEGVKTLPYDLNLDIATFQKDRFLNYGEWLEDEEAKSMFQGGPT